MESMPIVTVNLWYDRARHGRDPSSACQAARCNGSSTNGSRSASDASHLSLVSSGASRLTSMSGDELTRLAAREVEEAIPAARRARLIRAHRGSREARDFLSRAGQPHVRLHERPSTASILAGDWIDTGLPGTIESAVVSGHAAAESSISEC